MRSKPIICQIVSTGNIGGAERFVQWIAEFANQPCYTYVFIFLFKAGPIADSIKKLGYPVYVLNWKNGFTIKGRIQLIKLIRKIKPQLLQLHVSTPFLRILLKIFYSCPIIFYQHGSYWHFENLWYRILYYLDDRVTDFVLANSEFTADKHSQLFHRPRGKIKVIYPGINLKNYNLLNFYDENRDDTYKIIRIGFLGRLEECKGVLQLPYIAKYLVDRGFYNFELWIGGGGSAKEVVYSIAKELKVVDKLKFFGWCQDPHIFLNHLDIFLFTSLQDEAFGIVLVEALAAGLPIIAYDTGGVREVLEGMVETYLILNRDLKTFSETLYSICNNNFQRRKVLRQEVYKKFSFSRTVMELEAFYESILNSNC